MGIETALAVGTLALAAAGTGMSVYGQMQQADNAQRMAQYNAAVQQQNASVNQTLAMRQAAMAQQEAAFNTGMQQHQAAAYGAHAAQVSAEGRERARRMRMENERLTSMQRARFGRGGVTATGTPLVVLAESARLAELGVQDAAYQTEMERRGLLDRKRMSLLGADAYAASSTSQFQFATAAADAGYRMANTEANLTRISGGLDAAGYRMGAAGSLISGAAGIAGSAYDFNRYRRAS